jgi:hypothetical protein
MAREYAALLLIFALEQMLRLFADVAVCRLLSSVFAVNFAVTSFLL